MKSRTPKRFWAFYDKLPSVIQASARKQYRLWRENPRHPSLRFKRVSHEAPMFSARITDDYRALAIRKGDTFFWVWIGRHEEYERLIRRS